MLSATASTSARGGSGETARSAFARSVSADPASALFDELLPHAMTHTKSGRKTAKIAALLFRVREPSLDVLSSFMSDATQPIYSDRASGEAFQDARGMVNAYLERFASRAGTTITPLDDAGYTQLKKGSASVGVNVLEDHGVLLILAPVMEIPAKNREALYRRLLELSYITTSDAAFAIDAQEEKIYVRSLRRLSGLDYEEFEDLVATVGKVADEWDDLLKNEFGP